MSIRSKILQSGDRNFSIQVSGRGPAADFLVIDVKDLPIKSGRVDSLAIDAVYYVVADGVKVSVMWDSGDERFPILPLGGRGRIDFSEVRGLRDLSEGHGCALSIEVEGEGYFTIVLDLSKHMEV